MQDPAKIHFWLPTLIAHLTLIYVTALELGAFRHCCTLEKAACTGTKDLANTESDSGVSSHESVSFGKGATGLRTQLEGCAKCLSVIGKSSNDFKYNDLSKDCHKSLSVDERKVVDGVDPTLECVRKRLYNSSVKSCQTQCNQVYTATPVTKSGGLEKMSILLFDGRERSISDFI